MNEHNCKFTNTHGHNEALIHMDAALTHTHMHTQPHGLDSYCPFLSRVETAGLCHVNESRGSEIKLAPSFFSGLRHVSSSVADVFFFWFSVLSLQETASRKTDGEEKIIGSLEGIQKDRVNRREQNFYI